jgi:UDP-3-O-[3-hydroxymyristoyl] glucosamine N-acyltransferase
MTDDRFFERAGPFPLGEIAAHIGAEMDDRSAADFPICDVSHLEIAEAAEISLFYDAKYASVLAKTKAGAVITDRKLAAHQHNGARLLLSDNPRLAFAQVGHLFYPPAPLVEGLQPTLAVHPSAQVGQGAQIGQGGEIRAGARIGRNCSIGPNVVIGRGVVIGDDVVIGPNCTITHALIGNRVTFGPGNSIGNAGFSFVPSAKGPLRVPQLGRVTIADDVEFGANCVVDRGALGDTEIGRGCRFDGLIHVGHNVKMGAFCMVVAQAGIAGSVTIGPGVMIGGQAGIADHLTIGAGAKLAARAGVAQDVEAGKTVGGSPAQPIKQWHRQVVWLKKMVGNKG